MEQEQWLSERRRGIGGSDAAAILGLSPFKSALAVYLEKIGESDDHPDSERMYWGRRLERIIGEEYEKRTGLPVAMNDGQHISVHPEHDWMLCTLDGVIHDPRRGPGALECKNTNEFSKSEWDESEHRVPEYYLIQLMHNMGVTGYSWGSIPVLIGGNKFLYFDFDRDDELIDLIIEKERAFWYDNVLKKVPPDPTGASLDVLSKMYRKDNGSSIVLRQDEIGIAIHRYNLTKASLDELTRQNDEAKAIIQAAMGEAAQGIYQDGDVTYGISWSSVKGRVGFDAKAFEKDHPELYQKYMKTGASYRRFSIREKKLAIAGEKKGRLAHG